MLSVALIVFGMSAAFYTMKGLIQMLTKGDLERALSQSRISREIAKVKDHVIIFRFGRIGELLANDFSNTGRLFVVIENDPERIIQAKERKLLCLNCDASEQSTFMQAGVKDAKALITGLPSDAANVFITLTACDLNRDLQIIARAEHSSTEKSCGKSVPIGSSCRPSSARGRRCG